jgi:hypothetical protein
MRNAGQGTEVLFFFGKINYHLTCFDRNCAFPGVLNIDRKATFSPKLEAVNF